MTEPAPPTLAGRYRPEHLASFTPEEWARFVEPHATDARRALDGDADAWDRIAPQLAWELLYRVEPELYARLVEGEVFHPQVVAKVVDALPAGSTVVEVASGTGRLTLRLAESSARLVAVEPAASLRGVLQAELARRELWHVETVSGFFDEIPLPDGCADLVTSAAAFTADPAHGGDRGLAELERVTAPGGTIALVWPADVGWLLDRGFTYIRFPGMMAVDFGDAKAAVELARIFYPSAAGEVERAGRACVGYDVLGINPPNDLALRTMP